MDQKHKSILVSSVAAVSEIGDVFSYKYTTKQHCIYFEYCWFLEMQRIQHQ